MTNSISIISISLLLISMLSFGQRNNVKQPIIRIRSEINEPIPDSIKVSFDKGTIGPLHAKTIKAVKNVDDSFILEFQTDQEIYPYDLHIYFPSSKNRLHKEIFSISKLYAESSEDIMINISEVKADKASIKATGKLKFTGKGSINYKVNEILREMKNNLYSSIRARSLKLYSGQQNDSKNKVISSTYKLSNLNNHLNNLYHDVRSLMKRNQDTLKKYKGALSHSMSLQLNSEYNTPFHFYSWINWLYRIEKSEEAKHFIKNFYFSKVSSLDSLENNASNTKFSQGYAWVKGMKIMYEVDYKTSGKGFPFEMQYNEIKNLKNIQLRDVVLTKFFEENGYFQIYITNSDKRDSCLNDALSLVTGDELQNALKHQLLFAKGSKMPFFSFPDTAGKIISTADLAGKVYILDFYFNGCSSCSIFAKRFDKEIFPSFVNDKNFKILSVNTDLTKKKWIDAIKSGKYTQPYSVNLSTGKAGYTHPILQYYNIHSFPWVLLVDKTNKVVAFDLYALSSEHIIRLIRQSLNEDNTATVKIK